MNYTHPDAGMLLKVARDMRRAEVSAETAFKRAGYNTDPDKGATPTAASYDVVRLLAEVER